MSFRFSSLLVAAGLLSALSLPVAAQQTPAAPAATPAPPPTDVIVKRSGDEVPAVIVEVTPELVKYRRADNRQGPLFSVLRAEVFMIRYANGTKDVFSAPRPVAAPAPTYGTAAVPPPAPPTAADTVFAHVPASGPRIGLTVIGNGKLRDKLRDDYDASNVISQIGWQFESRLFSLPNGPTALVEFVPLIGGLEQNLFLPSISGILGLRGRSGLEVGLGPNLSLAGASLVLAAGHTFQSRFVNVPINFAVVPSRQGTRVSFLIGFTYRTQPAR